MDMTCNEIVWKNVSREILDIFVILQTEQSIRTQEHRTYIAMVASELSDLVEIHDMPVS